MIENCAKLFRAILCASVLSVSFPVPRLFAATRPRPVKNLPPDAAIQDQAKQLWEQAIEAKGGHAQLRKITSLYVAADFGEGFREHNFYGFPNYRFEYSYWAKRESTDIIVCNKISDVCWWQLDGDAAKPRRTNEDDFYSDLLPQVIYLMESGDTSPIPIRSRKERLDGDLVDVVETQVKGWTVDYYLSKRTHLPIKVVLPNGPRSRAKGQMNQEIRLADYQEIAGIMLPHIVSYAFTTNPTKFKERLRFELNPKYDPQVFDRAPTPRMGPESWRAKAEAAKNP